MASPPFNIDQSLPGDSDVVSQFPSVERTYRDIAESWIAIEHNVNGRHDQVRADWHTDATYPGIASVTSVWASSDDAGDLHKRHGANAIEWVGVPPGTVSARFDASVPNGWTSCNGAAISRTVAGARLFALYGTTYGIGDGSSTFNVPNCTGRVLVQLDASQSVVTGATGIGVAFGGNTQTIAQANLPNVNFAISGITLNDPQHFHLLVAAVTLGGFPTLSNTNQVIQGAGAGGQGQYGLSGDSTPATIGKSETKSTGITIATQGTAASGGSGTALSVVQPGITVNYVIKL